MYSRVLRLLVPSRACPGIQPWPAPRRSPRSSPASTSPEIEARGHAERRGLQIVDAVASGYWYGLNRNRYGHTEDRYARILHPLAYRRNGRCRSYGVKFFPPEVEALMKKDPACAWVRELRI